MGTVLFASSTEAMIFAFLASILGALIGQLSVSLLLKCATAGSLSDSVSKGSKLARGCCIDTYLFAHHHCCVIRMVCYSI